MGPKKVPKKAANAPEPPGHVPVAARGIVADGDGAHAHPVFSLAKIDRDDSNEEWGWHMLTDEDAALLVRFLAEIGASTWKEVGNMTGPGKQNQHRLHHHQDISTLCDAAQKRLARFYPTLGGEIYRFRLTDMIRLWGFEIGGMFIVVWWDPNHRVYRTD